MEYECEQCGTVNSLSGGTELEECEGCSKMYRISFV